MNIEYLSHYEEAQFGDLVHSDTELSEIFGNLMVQMEVDTDYDTVMLSFENDSSLRVAVEDSPYVIVLNEDSQVIELYARDQDHELILDGQYDFDEDGVETVVDIMASRILSEERDGFE